MNWRVQSRVSGHKNSLDGTIGEAWKTQAWEAAARTKKSQPFEMKHICITVRSWQVLMMGDGNMISIKQIYFPRRHQKDMADFSLVGVHLRSGTGAENGCCCGVDLFARRTFALLWRQ